MEYTKEDLNWLMKKTEECSNRYMEAEHFLVELMTMPWYKRIVLASKISKFLLGRNKYKF